MTTDPYRSDCRDLVRQTHEQSYKLSLTDGVTTWPATPLSATLSMREDWSPAATLSATLANTFTPEDLAAMDPRKSLTVSLEAGYVHPDGLVDVHTVFTGQLEHRLSRTPGAVLDIRASSAELHAHDAGYLAADTWKNFTGVNEAIAWLAGYATGGTVAVTSHLPAGHSPSLVNAVPITTGQAIWEVIADIALAADVRVFVDVDGTWTIAPRATEAAQVAAYLSTGNGGSVDTTDDALTRDGYYGAAILTFEWRDASGVDHTVLGTYGAPGQKTYTGTRKYPVSQFTANAAAQAVVRNLSTRGNSYDCTGAAVWWLRPGATVQVTLSNGQEARHIVKSLSFDVTAGTMTATTREPSNIGD